MFPLFPVHRLPGTGVLIKQEYISQ